MEEVSVPPRGDRAHSCITAVQQQQQQPNVPFFIPPKGYLLFKTVAVWDADKFEVVVECQICKKSYQTSKRHSGEEEGVQT